MVYFAAEETCHLVDQAILTQVVGAGDDLPAQLSADVGDAHQRLIGLLWAESAGEHVAFANRMRCSSCRYALALRRPPRQARWFSRVDQLHHSSLAASEGRNAAMSFGWSPLQGSRSPLRSTHQTMISLSLG